MICLICLPHSLQLLHFLSSVSPIPIFVDSEDPDHPDESYRKTVQHLHMWRYESCGFLPFEVVRHSLEQCGQLSYLQDVPLEAQIGRCGIFHPI